MSERRRLAERPRKVKYTRASPELASFATRPRRVRCVVYSVQCQKCAVLVCVLLVVLVLVCVFTVLCQCSSPYSHIAPPQIQLELDRTSASMMMLAQKSILCIPCMSVVARRRKELGSRARTNVKLMTGFFNRSA